MTNQAINGRPISRMIRLVRRDLSDELLLSTVMLKSLERLESSKFGNITPAQDEIIPAIVSE